MQIIVVLGKQPKPDGDLAELQGRLRKAVEIFDQGIWDRVLISGGKTRVGLDSEANLGEKYIRRDLGRDDVPITREGISRSTAENIIETKGLLRFYPIEQIAIITSRYHIWRSSYLLWRLWPEGSKVATYYGVGGLPFKECAAEAILLLLAILDPQEKFFLPLLKKRLRNG